MILKTKLFGHHYQFGSIREVMAKANEEKSGDKLAGIAADSAEERVAAKVVLSHFDTGGFAQLSSRPLRRGRGDAHYSG